MCIRDRQHVGRDRRRGFHQARVGAGLFLGGRQQAVAAVEFTQAVRGARGRQRGQHAAGLHLGLFEQLGQIFFGVRITAFEQADPAALEQLVVTRLGALAAPSADAIGNRQQPGQQAQAHRCV